MKNKETTLSQMLEKLNTEGRYPMHMPGHKRSFPDKSEGIKIPYNIDVTEIEGFDNLHSMSGVLKRLSERAANLYGAEKAYVTVGGSTCGILSSIRAMTCPGDCVIVARNCHKSVYHALSICRLRAEYVYPESDPETGIFGSVKAEDIKSALEKCPNARLVIITSPTYEGVVSNLKSISDTVHACGSYLLVDAAHGAHILPDMVYADSPYKLGENTFLAINEIKYADVAILSLHKTLPSLTQTALVLVYAKKRCIEERIYNQLNVFESSSPSYILLYSVEKCIELLECRREALFSDWARRAYDFENFATELKNIKIFGYTYLPCEPLCFDFDKSKISVLCNRFVFKDTQIKVRGKDIADILRRHNIEPEMIAPGYVLLMTSICDTDRGYEMLKCALHKIDGMLDYCEDNESCIVSYPKNQAVKEIYECDFLCDMRLSPEMAEGRVSTSYITPYPPGIPLAVPGELINREVTEALKQFKDSGVDIENGDEISVLL